MGLLSEDRQAAQKIISYITTVMYIYLKEEYCE